MRKITILGLNFTKQTRDTQWDISMSNFNNISQHSRVENLYTNFYEFFWKRGRRRRKKGGRHTVQFIRGAFKIQMSSLWKFLRRGSILLRIAKIFRRVEIRRNEVDGEKKKKKKRIYFRGFLFVCSRELRTFQFHVGWQLFSKDGYCHLCEMKFRIDCEPETFHITILISRATFTLADDRWLASEPYGKCTCFTESLIECAGTCSFFFCSPLFAVMVAQRWEENYYTMWKIFLVQ